MKISDRIIKLAQKDDVDALDYIIDNYSNLAYYHSLTIVKDKFAAEDCAQVAIEKIASHLKEYDFNSSSFNTWAYTIINNTALNYIKVNERYNKRVVNDVEVVYTYCDDNNETNDLNILMSDIKRIVGELDYQILILKLGNNFRFSDISEALNITESKAKRRYYEAIEKVKKQLEGQYEKENRKDNTRRL